MLMAQHLFWHQFKTNWQDCWLTRLDWQMMGTETDAAQHVNENVTGKLYQKEQISLDGQGRRKKWETAEGTPRAEEEKEGSGGGGTPGAEAHIHCTQGDPHQRRLVQKTCSPARSPCWSRGKAWRKGKSSHYGLTPASIPTSPHATWG